MKQIDVTTGAVLQTLALPDGTTDLDWDGSHVLVADVRDHVVALDPDTGAAAASYDTPFLAAERGIAWKDGHLWAVSWTNDDLAIIDGSNVHIGLARTDLDAASWWYESGLFMAFADDQLAMVAEDRVYLLALHAVDAPPT
jgi:hypothetical protein